MFPICNTYYVLHMYYTCMNYMCNTNNTTHVLHMYYTCNTHVAYFLLDKNKNGWNVICLMLDIHAKSIIKTDTLNTNMEGVDKPL